MGIKDIPEMAKNIGRFSDLTPEERSAMAKKGWETKRKIAEQKAKLEDKQGLLNEAVAAVMTEDPEVIAKILANIATTAADPDHKGSLAAADLFLKHAGITAPKQQEVVVEDSRSIEETTKELESLGVSVKGLKVVK